METVSEPKFSFYEKVLIRLGVPRGKSVNTKLGAVVGRSVNEAGHWYYAVFVYDQQLVCSCAEEELSTIGEFDSRENLYSGETIRVRADKFGHGEIVGRSSEGGG